MLGVEIEEAGALELARRSREPPGLANRLLKRVRDFAQVKYNGVITREVTDFALDIMDVDKLGLDQNDRNILLMIIENSPAARWAWIPLAAALGRLRNPGGSIRTISSYERSDQPPQGAAWPLNQPTATWG